MGQFTLILTVGLGLALVVALWGASLFARAWAYRLDALMSRTRSKRRRVVIAGPCSRGQMWLGLVGGPLITLAAVVPAKGVLTIALDPFARTTSMQTLAGAMGVTLIALATMTLWVGWRFDPAKGRRRCPECWYELADLPLGTPCPECGHVASDEAQTLRARRSTPVLTIGAVLLLVGGGLLITPLALNGALMRAIPSAVLISGWRWLPEGPIMGGRWSGSASLWDRTSAGRLSARDAARLRARVLAEIASPTNYASFTRALWLMRAMQPPTLNSPVRTRPPADVTAAAAGALAQLVKLLDDPAQRPTAIRMLRELYFVQEVDITEEVRVHEARLLAEVNPAGTPDLVVALVLARHASASDGVVDAIVALGTVADRGAAPPPATTWPRFASALLKELLDRAPNERRGAVLARLLDGSTNEQLIAARMLAQAEPPHPLSQPVHQLPIEVLTRLRALAEDPADATLLIPVTLALLRNDPDAGADSASERRLVTRALWSNAPDQDDLLEFLAWHGRAHAVALPSTTLALLRLQQAAGPSGPLMRLWGDTPAAMDPCNEATLPWFRDMLADPALPAAHARAIRELLAPCAEKLEDSGGASEAATLPGPERQTER